MKQLRSSVSVLRLAIGALLIASTHQSVKASDKDSSNPSGAIFANSATDGGHLVIRRSPSLGHNVTIYLSIDGQLAGTLTRGRTFDRYITPGRHVLTATPKRSSRSEWQGTLEVRRGETYSYTASYSNKLVLTPASGSH